MTTQIRAFEPLTTQNAMLVLVDHQVGFMTGVRDYSTAELKSTAATRLMWIAKRPALCSDQSYELTDFSRSGWLTDCLTFLHSRQRRRNFIWEERTRCTASAQC